MATSKYIQADPYWRGFSHALLAMALIAVFFTAIYSINEHFEYDKSQQEKIEYLQKSRHRCRDYDAFLKRDYPEAYRRYMRGDY